MKADAAEMPGRLARSAFELFAERGFPRVSLDDIAARAGVTKGSLYWHFASKQEVILAACQYYYQRWHATVQRRLSPIVDPAARLREVISFSVESCVVDRRNRLFTTGIFMLMQEDAAVRASWSQFYSVVREVFVGLALAAQATGQLPAGDVRRPVDLMLEAMEGLKLRAGFEPQVARRSEQARLAEGLWGVLARPGIPTGMAA